MFIGITGRARSGKDTTAELLQMLLNQRCWESGTSERFRLASFAEPYKEHLGALFGLSHEQLYGNLKTVVDERWGVTPRYIIQVVISDMLRARWPDIVSRGPCSPFVRYADHTIITDVRIPGEAAILHELGGFLIRVERPGQSREIGGVADHSTERDIENLSADFVIQNDGPLWKLRSEVESAAEILWGRYQGRDWRQK